MAYITSNDPLTDANLAQKLQELQNAALQNAQAINSNAYTWSGTATTASTFGSTLGGSALKSKLFNRMQATTTAAPKKDRDISVSSVLRGINGLLFKIGEMKGQR